MSELAWLVSHDCDFAAAQSHLTPDRAHFLDMPALASPRGRQAMIAAGSQMVKPITDRPRPWHIQTHLPLNFLPPALLDTCKVGDSGPDPVRATPVSTVKACIVHVASSRKNLKTDNGQRVFGMIRNLIEFVK